MKTVLHAPLFLGNDFQSDPWRFDRNIRFVNYYRKLKKELGFEQFVFSDNASSPKMLTDFYLAAESVENDDIRIISHHQFLNRGPNHDYPYCWQALYDWHWLIGRGYEKILAIDTDFFVLTKKLATYLKNLETGWISLWCPKYACPEAACQVLCKDKFDLYNLYTIPPFRAHNFKQMEFELPFTWIEKGFEVDRFGETETLQDLSMDGYAQASNTIELKFETP